MNYDWNFGRLTPYAESFMSGLQTTIALTLLIILIGTILGIILGFPLSWRSTRLLGYVLVDPLRAVPPLVMLLFAYYFFVPQVVGITIPSFWVAVIALSINLAVFTADVVRAAIESVPRSALDAGRALGLSPAQVNRHIVFPHVLRTAAPAMTVLYIGMLKLTSLAAVINVRELVYAAQTVIADVSRSLEAWTIVALLYIILVVPSVLLSRRVEVWAHRGRERR